MQMSLATLAAEDKPKNKHARLANVLMGKAFDQTPISHPMQGLGRMANAYVAGLEQKDADAARAPFGASRTQYNPQPQAPMQIAPPVLGDPNNIGATGGPQMAQMDLEELRRLLDQQGLGSFGGAY